MSRFTAPALPRLMLLATALTFSATTGIAYAAELLPEVAPPPPSSPTITKTILEATDGLTDWSVNTWNTDGKDYGGSAASGTSASARATFTPGPDVVPGTHYAYYIRPLPDGALKPNQRYKLVVSAKTCAGCETAFQISLSSENKFLDDNGKATKTGYRTHQFARTINLKDTKNQIKTIEGFFLREGLTEPQQFYVRIRPLKANVPFYVTGLTLQEIETPVVPNPATELRFGQAPISPNLSTLPFPREMFGQHINELGTHNTWVELGQSVVRTWGNYEMMWHKIQPQAGIAFNWSIPDYFTSRILEQRSGVNFIYTLGQTPAWAAIESPNGCSYDSGCAAPKIDSWRAYVRAMAAKFKGTQIKYFELWNEPYTANFFQAAGATAPQHLKEMACTAQNELKGSGIQLIGPNLMPDAFSDEFLAAGGGDCVDIMSMHAYFTPFDIEKDLPQRIANIKFLMRDHGLQTKPLWNTEGAAHCAPDPAHPNQTFCRDRMGTPKAPTEGELKGTMLRAFASMWANGIQNFDYFFLEGGFDSWSGLSSRKDVGSTCKNNTASGYCVLEMKPTPLGQGYARAKAWFTGQNLVAAYTNKEQNVHIYESINPNQVRQRVIWNTGTTAKEVTLPASWAVSQTVSQTGVSSNYAYKSECALFLGKCISPVTKVGNNLTLLPLQPVLLK